MSSKSDIPIAILAEEVVPLGYQVINLWANSMGAYFSLLAYKGQALKQGLFLSPVLDMLRIIQNMMRWFEITEERLFLKKEITIPIHQTLYWDYFQYVQQSPITEWDVPTSILYGRKDELCEYDIVSFVQKFNCNFDVPDNSEHFFHTEEDLTTYREWLKNNIMI